MYCRRGIHSSIESKDLTADATWNRVLLIKKLLTNQKLIYYRHVQ